MTYPQRRIYALAGVPPEVQAYAMAKYSRSSQGMLESVEELSAQRTEQFLTTFYFEYGHKSIADLAHIVLALENISILAAIRLVDETLWDGQERSTRYQDFRKSGYYTPAGLAPPEADRYRTACDALFAAYEEQTQGLTDILARVIPRPDDLDQGRYRRTLRARAFDVSRSLLPLATHTSVGQIVSARVVERQISRLLADPYAEVREVGNELREACVRPPDGPLLEAVFAEHPELRERLAPPAAPTLVKYAAPDTYRQQVNSELASRAVPYLARLGAPDLGGAVELSASPGPLRQGSGQASRELGTSLELELAATLLYRTSPDGHSYRACLDLCAGLSTEERRSLIEPSFTLRGRHDDLLREHQAGAPLAFDLLFDLGSFRDLHRHRRCVQILPELSLDLGYADPEQTFERGLTTAGAELARTEGWLDRYREALDSAIGAAHDLASAEPLAARYLLPLASRTRALFKMDFAEAAHITELRTGVGGHFSYRHVAWEMYQALSAQEPELARHLRVTDPNETIDFLSR